jgi:hypothetical protein
MSAEIPEERFERRWQELDDDPELRLAIRASESPECQWFCAWLDDVAHPAWTRGRRARAPIVRYDAQSVEILSKAVAAARLEIAKTPIYWQPERRPGPKADDPEGRRRRSPRARASVQLMLPGEWPTTPLGERGNRVHPTRSR